MTRAQSKSERKESRDAYLKMRSEYRAKFANTKLADMVIEINDEDYADKPSGLLNGPKLKDGLKVYIPKWDNLPPPTLAEFIQLQVAKGSGDFENVGPPKEFIIPEGQVDFPDTFPNEMIISGSSDLPLDATCRLRYTHRSYHGSEVDSQIRTVICDQLPPYKNVAPAAPVFTGDFLDDSNLPAGSRLTVTIPGYPDWTPTDPLAV